MRLIHTRQAVAHYDVMYPILLDQALNAPNEKALAILDKIEALEREVGIAFWKDTFDRNSLDTCKQCIRPGLPGSDSFVRRMLLKENTCAPTERSI